MVERTIAQDAAFVLRPAHCLGPYTTLGRVGLDVIVDTRDRAHAQSVLQLVHDAGFPAEELLDTGPRRA